MAYALFPPPFTAPAQLLQQLQQQGYAVLAPSDTAAWLGCSLEALEALAADWQHLPPDDFLRDGGRYRFRRHASMVVQGGQVALQAHRAHWQPVDYNALHGGMQRWFAPMLEATTASTTWQALVAQVAGLSQDLFQAGARQAPCFVEAHQFRIDTASGIGRPTPEGAHRDGVDLVAVFLVGRSGIKGGESRIFEARAPWGLRFTLEQPWSLLLLDDARMVHETTPIQPEAASQPGVRDTLVLTCRSGGFQSQP
ncbi:MAG: 2OG-Fe dioxygenase family protein [Comamonas sp.]|nr:2OG-Fe dioxygenase family protein [Comamonas sp.]